MKIPVDNGLSQDAIACIFGMRELMKQSIDEMAKALLIAQMNKELNEVQELFLEAWGVMGSAERAKWKEYVDAGDRIKFRMGQ